MNINMWRVSVLEVSSPQYDMLGMVKGEGGR